MAVWVQLLTVLDSADGAKQLQTIKGIGKAKGQSIKQLWDDTRGAHGSDLL